jgi:hypothetical protein
MKRSVEEMQDDVEDVWAIVRERDGLRAKVKRLEIENRRLQAIVSGYTSSAPMKPVDVDTANADRHRLRA